MLRRRYYAWLLRAYIKKWKNAILLSLTFGGLIFFLLLNTFRLYISPFLQSDVNKIGYSGTFTIDTLPDSILEKISYGLTRIEKNGEIKPAAASSWEIKNNGKEYVFTLKKKQRLHNNEELTSYNLPFDFKDAKKKPLDRYRVSYLLKKPYAPFLALVSKPILVKGMYGLGPYKIASSELNANFVKSLVLENIKETHKKDLTYFYPTEKALKIAFVLGEVDYVIGLSDLSFNDTTFALWNTANAKKSITYGKIVSVFYNNNDTYLSNKKIRQSLNYALPEDFKELGERAYVSYSPQSIYYSKPAHYQIGETEIAKTLLASSNVDPKEIQLTITTTKNFEPVAKIVQDSWKKLQINVSIKILDEVPAEFQVLIRSLKIPKDPDQYTIWHSAQKNNIAHYKNLRIDKLLEDGRITIEQGERIPIYADFQKYLLDDAPVSFLYYPAEYTLQRK